MTQKRIYFSPKKIALLALLSALAVVGRLILIGVPNVQPVTVILLIITFEMGWKDGLIVSALSIVVSNLLLGSMGPWTLYQVASFMIVVSVWRILKPLYVKISQRWSYGLFAVLAGLAGYVYGFVISLFSVWLFHMPNFWAYYFQGLAYDSFHALGNCVFWLLLAPILPQLIRRF